MTPMTQGTQPPLHVAGAARPGPDRTGPRIMPAPAEVVDGFDFVFTVRTDDVALVDGARTIRLTLLAPSGVRVPVGRR
jgi:hypothetical protein